MFAAPDALGIIQFDIIKVRLVLITDYEGDAVIAVNYFIIWLS